MQNKKLLKRGLALGLAAAMTLTMAPNVGLLNGISVVQAGTARDEGTYVLGDEYKAPTKDSDNNVTAAGTITIDDLSTSLGTALKGNYIIQIDSDSAKTITANIENGNTLTIIGKDGSDDVVHFGAITVKKGGKLVVGAENSTALSEENANKVKVTVTMTDTLTVNEGGEFDQLGTSVVDLDGKSVVLEAGATAALAKKVTVNESVTYERDVFVAPTTTPESYYKTDGVDITLLKADGSKSNISVSKSTVEGAKGEVEIGDVNLTKADTTGNGTNDTAQIAELGEDVSATVNGNFNVQADCTLKIDAGATLTVADGGTLDADGTIELAAKSGDSVAKIEVESNGTLDAAANNTVDFKDENSSIVVKPGGIAIQEGASFIGSSASCQYETDSNVTITLKQVKSGAANILATGNGTVKAHNAIIGRVKQVADVANGVTLSIPADEYLKLDAESELWLEVGSKLAIAETGQILYGTDEIDGIEKDANGITIETDPLKITNKGAVLGKSKKVTQKNYNGTVYSSTDNKITKVAKGGTFELTAAPAGYYWVDASGNVVTAENKTINEDTVYTLTAQTELEVSVTLGTSDETQPTTYTETDVLQVTVTLTGEDKTNLGEVGATYSYAWTVGASSTTPANTATSYTIASTDIGETIKVVVTPSITNGKYKLKAATATSDEIVPKYIYNKASVADAAVSVDTTKTVDDIIKAIGDVTITSKKGSTMSSTGTTVASDNVTWKYVKTGATGTDATTVSETNKSNTLATGTYTFTGTVTLPSATWTKSTSDDVTVEKEVTVTGVDISSADVTLADGDTYEYTGNDIEPTVTVKLTTDGAALEKDTDYTVAYADNKNAGTAKVTITGIGKYSGTVTKNFTISQKTVATAATDMTTILADPGTIDGKTVKYSVTAFTSGGDYGTPKAETAGTISGTANGNSTETNFDTTIIKSAKLSNAGLLSIEFESNVATMIANNDNATITFAEVETANYKIPLTVTVKFTASATATVVVSGETTYTYTGEDLDNPAVTVNDVVTTTGLTYKYYTDETEAANNSGTSTSTIKDAGTYYLVVGYSLNGITGTSEAKEITVKQLELTCKLPSGEITTNDTYTLPTADEIKALATSGTSVSVEMTVTDIQLEQNGEKVDFEDGGKLPAGSYAVAATVTPSDTKNVKITVVNGTLTVADSSEPEPEPETCTVTFDANEGTFVTSGSAITVTSGSSISLDGKTLPEVKREGYKFLGWFTAKTGGTPFTDETKISGDLTVYAQWEKEEEPTPQPQPTTYTVTFNANYTGATAVSPASITVTVGETYPDLPTLMRSGYTFNGWYTAATNGTQVKKGDPVSLTADTTLYAHWTQNSNNNNNNNSNNSGGGGNGGGTPADPTTPTDPTTSDDTKPTTSTSTTTDPETGNTINTTTTTTKDDATGTTTTVSTAVETDADGNEVKTTTTETVEASDGSKTETETVTNADGTSEKATTTTSANGASTSSHAYINTSGNVTDITTVDTNANGKSEVAEYDATSGTKVTLSDVDTTKTKISVPATITVITADGTSTTYKVTAIAKNAAKGEKTVKTVVVGANITKIGASAFAGCTKLTKATIGKNVKTIAKNTFKGDKKLKTITLKGGKVTSIGKGAFSGIAKKATIKINGTAKQVKKITKLIKKSGVAKTVKIKKA